MHQRTAALGRRAGRPDANNPYDPFSLDPMHPKPMRSMPVVRTKSDNTQTLVTFLLIVVAGLIGWTWFNNQSTSAAAAAPISVIVATEPKGASVTIDNDWKGYTPLPSLDLPGGQHQITVTLDGYESYNSFFSAKKPLPVVIKLKPKPQDAPDQPPSGN
jgi:hypothetical protein